MPALRALGDCTVRGTRARSVQAPGGWGAEESGAQTQPGPNQLCHVSQPTRARGCSKLGFIVKFLNESVSEEPSRGKNISESGRIQQFRRQAHTAWSPLAATPGRRDHPDASNKGGAA